MKKLEELQKGFQILVKLGTLGYWGLISISLEILVKTNFKSIGFENWMFFIFMVFFMTLRKKEMGFEI